QPSDRTTAGVAQGLLNELRIYVPNVDGTIVSGRCQMFVVHESDAMDGALMAIERLHHLAAGDVPNQDGRLLAVVSAGEPSAIGTDGEVGNSAPIVALQDARFCPSPGCRVVKVDFALRDAFANRRFLRDLDVPASRGQPLALGIVNYTGHAR